MKIAIMQPYFMPYIGYFQLIKSVDRFVVCDDVQYIKQGWINRNRLLINGEPKLFTFSLKKDHNNYNINKRYFSSNFKKDKEKLMRILKGAYKKAPYYSQVEELISNILKYDNNANIGDFIDNSIREVCKYLGIETEIIKSSNIEKDNTLKCQDKVIDIIKKVHWNIYINSIGGTALYSKDVFKENNIELYFLKWNELEYKQFHNKFVSDLSIIDVMMFKSVEDIQKLLNQYTLS